MIKRAVEGQVVAALERQAAVAIVGPRQVGKTTLALKIARSRPSVYLDLEAPQDVAKLQAPELFLERHTDKLIVLDEIHRTPDLFQVLRGVIDRARRSGRRAGLFLILGSASVALLRQSGETLAGRIAYVQLGPVTAPEVPPDRNEQDRLWLRGGFPDSFLAATDADSFLLRQDLIRTYLERDVPQLGPRVPAETLRRLWTMLAHNQGQLLNASRLAASFGAVLDNRRPLPRSTGRPVAAAASGTAACQRRQALGQVAQDLCARLGASSTLCCVSRHSTIYSDTRSSARVGRAMRSSRCLPLPLGPTSASTERQLAPKWTSFWSSAARGVAGLSRSNVGSIPGRPKDSEMRAPTLRPTRTFVVYSGTERYALTPDVEAIGLRELAAQLRMSE